MHARHCTAGQRSGGLALASARVHSLLLLVQAASKRGACGPEGGIAVGSHAKCWDIGLRSGSPAGVVAPQHEHVGANRDRPSLQACSLGADHAGGALQTCSSLLACWSGPARASAAQPFGMPLGSHLSSWPPPLARALLLPPWLQEGCSTLIILGSPCVAPPAAAQQAQSVRVVMCMPPSMGINAARLQIAAPRHVRVVHAAGT